MNVPGGQYKVVPMQSAAVATGNGTAITVTNATDGAYSVLVCQVKGITTATVTFEGTVDGTNWVAIGFTSLADGSTVATTATADGLYRCTVLGLLQVRARISAWTTGAVTVTGLLVS